MTRQVLSMANLFSTVLLSLLLQSSSSTIFEIALWPGENTPIFEAVSTPLQLHERPSSTSPFSSTVNISGQRIAFVNVSAGKGVTYDDTRYRTTKAGRIRALVASQVMGRMIGNVTSLSREDYHSDKFPQADIDVKSGASFDYLQYRAEASCFIRIAGKVIDTTPCPANDKTRFRVEMEPQVEWWIHVVIGNSRGWALVSDSTVKDVGRE
jgi:hypothetical protein